MLVVDIRHWLSKHGDLPTKPAPLRRNALRVARLIEYNGPLEVGHSRETLVECTKRPGRRPCLGLMWVMVRVNPVGPLSYCRRCERMTTNSATSGSQWPMVGVYSIAWTEKGPRPA